MHTTYHIHDGMVNTQTVKLLEFQQLKGIGPASLMAVWWLGIGPASLMAVWWLGIGPASLMAVWWLYLEHTRIKSSHGQCR